MNVLQIASMVKTLGLSVNFAALGPLLPLLNKKAVEITQDDVQAVFNLVGLASVDPEIAAEAANAIRLSDFDKISDLLGNEQYLMPIMQRVVYSQKRLTDRLIADMPLVPVLCEHCGRVNNVIREEAVKMDPTDIIKVRCVQCETYKHVTAASVTTFGV